MLLPKSNLEQFLGRLNLKHLMRKTTILVMILIVSGPVLAQQGRKLPQGAYLKTAKIEMSYAEANHDMARYGNAIAMLDSLFAQYGPIPEGLSLMSRIMGPLMEHATDPEAKAEWARKFVSFADSLKWACNSPVVKEMDKKNCQDLTALADSMRVMYWREFHSAGMEQMKAEQMDSAQLSFQICLELNPNDTLASSALVELNQRQK